VTIGRSASRCGSAPEASNPEATATSAPTPDESTKPLRERVKLAFGSRDATAERLSTVYTYKSMANDKIQPRSTRLIVDGGPRSAPIDIFRAAGPDDAPRLAAYDAAVIGIATIDTTITPRPEPTGPVTLAPA
jgi:hypothetical protein